MLLANSSTGALVDLLALIVLLGFAFLGLKKGFTKTFVSMFGTLFSLLFAVLLCKSAVSFLESKYQLVTSISNWTSGFVSRFFGADITTLSLEEASVELLKSTNLSSWLIGLILSVRAQGSVDTSATLDSIISPVLGYYIVLIIALIVLYILYTILLKNLSLILANTIKPPKITKYSLTKPYIYCILNLYFNSSWITD